MPDSEKKHKFPKANVLDKLVSGVKIAVSVVPVVGGPGVEALSLLDSHFLLGKRREKFWEDVAQGLELFEELTPENLVNNDAFLTTLLHATQAAIKTHQKEKLKALRNAVLNSALPSAPDEDMQLIFINLLDSMTASHMRMLMFLDDPEPLLKSVVSDDKYLGVKGYIRAAFPEMDQTFCILIVKQLMEKGLTEAEFDVRYPQSFSFTTELGKNLLRFIKSPTEKEHDGSPE